MTNRMVLHSLTLVSAERESATVRFGESLSVVQGPSDTGKTFLVDCIDFVLGAAALREIPELRAYKDVLLAITLTDSSSITLQRPVSGGNISVYNGTLESIPNFPPDQTLRFKHSAGDEKTLSGFLLAGLGLQNRILRKNKLNKTVSLSFRDIAHLCVVDEVAMQSDVAPHLTGQYTTGTKEISAFRAVLEDTDDSGLSEVEDTSNIKKLSLARTDVLDGLIADVSAKLVDRPSRDDVLAQIAKLNAQVHGQTDSVNGRYARRDQLGEERSRNMRLERARRLRQKEIDETMRRFEVLRAQYVSDIERIDLMAEAGSIWGYFGVGVCLYCGAAVEHQHPQVVPGASGLDFETALRAERERTLGLAHDLDATLGDLEMESERLEGEVNALESRRLKLTNAFHLAELEAVPVSQGLRSMLSVREEMQSVLSIYDQLDTLEQARRAAEHETSSEIASSAEKINGNVLDEFSLELRTTLERWGYPHAETVRFDRTAQDVWAHGQLRVSHGKGVRALLHAAFSVALAQYCLERDLPHPGFVVLDSPLVTYRAPEVAADGTGEVVVVAERFYSDLESRFLGQAIVIENVDVVDVAPETIVTAFTGVANSGRPGFLHAQ